MAFIATTVPDRALVCSIFWARTFWAYHCSPVDRQSHIGAVDGLLAGLAGRQDDFAGGRGFVLDLADGALQRGVHQLLDTTPALPSLVTNPTSEAAAGPVG